MPKKLWAKKSDSDPTYQRISYQSFSLDNGSFGSVQTPHLQTNLKYKQAFDMNPM